MAVLAPDRMLPSKLICHENKENHTS